MSNAAVSHDITISTLAGTALGFMLARDQNGRRDYSMRQSQVLQPRVMSMGELTDAEFPPDIELIWTQNDWQRGIGGVTQRRDPLKLQKATKIDATQMFLRQGQHLTTATVNTNPGTYDTAGFARVRTEVWAFIGDDAYQWNYTGSAWRINAGHPALSAATNVVRNAVEYLGYSIAAVHKTGANPSPDRYLTKTDGKTSWTRVAAAPAAAGEQDSFLYFAVADGKLWGARSRQIFSTTTAGRPTSADWSASTIIGRTSALMTGLLGAGNTLLILMSDGVHAYYNNGTQENLTPGFEKMYSDQHFKGGFMWSSRKAILPTYPDGLWELDVGVNGRIDPVMRDISLKHSLPQQTQFHGQVVAVAGNPQFLFVLVDDASNTKYHLLQAEFVEFEGKTEYNWHHIGDIAYTTGTVLHHATLFVEGVPSGTIEHHRIWVGVHSTGSNLLPAFYPLSGDAEEGYTNDTDPVAVTVAHDFNLPKVSKTFVSLDVETRNGGTGGRQWDGYYVLDEASRVSIGTFDVSPTKSIDFAAGITGKIIQLEFEPKLTSVGTTAAELLNFRLKAMLRPGSVRLLPLHIYLADNQMLLNGATGGRPKADLAQLIAWKDQAAAVTVVTPEGASINMVFLTQNCWYEEIAHEKGRRSEYIFHALLAEVT